MRHTQFKHWEYISAQKKNCPPATHSNQAHQSTYAVSDKERKKESTREKEGSCPAQVIRATAVEQERVEVRDGGRRLQTMGPTHVCPLLRTYGRTAGWSARGQ